MAAGVSNVFDINIKNVRNRLFIISNGQNGWRRLSREASNFLLLWKFLTNLSFVTDRQMEVGAMMSLRRCCKISVLFWKSDNHFKINIDSKLVFILNQVNKHFMKFRGRFCSLQP